ncbi:sensor histidine kinase [Bacillus salitolerans]|uniref:histidine kinase n=1 Tax=Bacillus salitolerans TaxID=1437434 RepID=A0ABW4LIP8_9BACI
MKQSREWVWTDWFIFFIRFCWFATGLLYFYVYPDNLSGFTYGHFLILLSLAYFLPQLMWNPGYYNPTLYPIVECIVTGSISYYLYIMKGVDLGSNLLLLPALMIAYLSTKKTAIWTFPVFLVLLPTLRYSALNDPVLFLLSYIDIFMFFGFGVSLNVILQSQLRSKQLLEKNVKQFEMIQKQNEVLEQYSSQIEKLTLYEERNRLARDLHDTIGHHFTSVTVGLDAALMLIDTNPELAKKKVELLATVSRNGLDEIRKSIHQIAPPENPKSLTEQLKQIATSFETYTGTTVNFHIKGVEIDLPPNIKITMLRCLQESLTNGKRHGNATLFEITVTFTEDQLIMNISNNGEKIEHVSMGFGLKSMRDRLEELQGNLAIINHAEQGVTLTCSIPVIGKENMLDYQSVTSR